jgi:hypothetical protein
LLLSPTIFLQKLRTVTHLATGYLRHIAAPWATGWEGPVTTRCRHWRFAG